MAVSEPADYISSMPANATSMIFAFARETSKSRHCREYPSVPTRQARDIVAAQNFTPWRVRLVHPPRY